MHLQESRWQSSDSWPLLWQLNERKSACNIQYLQIKADNVPSSLSRPWIFACHHEWFKTIFALNIYYNSGRIHIYNPSVKLLGKWSEKWTISWSFRDLGCKANFIWELKSIYTKTWLCWKSKVLFKFNVRTTHFIVSIW